VYSFAALSPFGDGQYLSVMRPYSADIGRWLSEDPVGLRAGLNLSRYVENSPIARIDFLGLASAPCPQPCTPKFDRKAYTSCVLNWTPEAAMGAVACTAAGVYYGLAGVGVAAPTCTIVTAVSLTIICYQCAQVCQEDGRSLGQCFPDSLDEEMTRPESGDPRRPTPPRPPRGPRPGGRR
jgi:hypothetical protein